MSGARYMRAPAPSRAVPLHVPASAPPVAAPSTASGRPAYLRAVNTRKAEPERPADRPELTQGPMRVASAVPKVQDPLAAFQREADKKDGPAPDTRTGEAERDGGAAGGKAPKAKKPDARGAMGVPAETAIGAEPGAGGEGEAKGRARSKAPRAKLERLASTQPVRPNLVVVPEPDTGPVTLGRDRLTSPATSGGFATPADPRFQAPRRTGAKQESVSPEQVRAVETFRAAMAAARRLHDDLLADARATLARVEAGADQLAARRRNELDQAIAGLEEGLRASRSQFDHVADAAMDMVDQGEKQARVAIRRTAAAAFGALNGAKAAADATFKTHGTNKDQAKKDADGKAGSVTTAGASASGAVLALDQTKEKDHPTTGDSMPAAINEAINVRLPTRTPARAKTYTEEASAEFAQLSATFTAMKTAIDRQFKDIAGQMTKTAEAGTSSIVKVRDGALRQLAESATQLRASIDETRANGHVSLVRQHDQSRRQLLAAWRDRGRGEDQSAQQRATRGVNAATALANGQQAGAKSLADNLDREKARPAEDFAKVVRSSAVTLVNHLGRSGPDQRARVLRSVEAGESGAVRQGESTAARLAGTARQMVERLDEAGQSAGTSLTRQISRSVEAFDKLPDPIVNALGGALSSARKAYAGQNKQAGEKVTEANAVVTNAMAGKGGGSGDGKAATPVGAGAEGPKAKEIPDQFVARTARIAAQASTDDGIAELIATAGKQVPPIINSKVGALNSALVAFSTPIEPVMAALRNITALQGKAISDVYRDHYKRSLEAHLRSELWKTFSADSTNRYNIDAAINYLHGNHVAAALSEMKAAVNYSNDEGRVERIQRSLTPAELDQLRREHPDELKDIIEDLGGTDRKVSEALNRIKPVDPRSPDAATQEKANLEALGVANAYGLKEQIDRSREKRGEEGGDATADMLAGKRQSIGDDVLSGGDALTPMLEDREAAQARKDKIWAATEQGFDQVVTTLPDGSPNVAKPGDKNPPGAIARYAAAVRTYEEFVPDNSERGGHFRTVSEGLDPRQTQLIDAIVKHGAESEQAAAATLAVELNRKSGKPKEDRLRKALGSDLLAAREGESDVKRDRRLKGLDEQGKQVDKGDRKRAEERRQKILLMYADLTGTEQQAEAERGKPAPDPAARAGRVKDEIVNRLGVQLAFDPTARAYTQSMVTGLEPDPVLAFDFALAHEEKNKETLQATVGRLNRDQIDEAVKRWDAKYPQGPPLYKRLGLFEHGSGALEGDARNETEIKFMGVPRDDRERAETANMAAKQQRRDSGAAGRAMASEEYQRMLATQAKLLGLMGVTAGDIDQYGRIKKVGRDGQPIRANFDKDGRLVVKTEGQRAEFESAMQFVYLDAESYKAAVDRAAMGVTMALMVIAAAITTFVTFGGAAAIWAPILIMAGAGLAGIAMTAAIKGDRYTRAEIERDLVMTFVMAATAGLGAYAGTALRGGSAAAKAAASSEKVVGGIAGIAEKQALSMGAKAMNFGKEVLIDSAVGGTTNAINSAAGAAMDPENRRQGKSGQKAFEHGIRGFLSSAVGSALTKPVGALAKPFGKMSERISGNVARGFTTRLTEARVGQAMGDPHQSWAESLEAAKEGIAQDVIQGAAEHHAEGLAERRAAVKARRAARAEAEAPEITRPPADEPATVTKPAAPEAEHAASPAGRLKVEEPLARAAAVHEALPPELRPAVDAARRLLIAPREPLCGRRQRKRNCRARPGLANIRTRSRSAAGSRAPRPGCRRGRRPGVPAVVETAPPTARLAAGAEAAPPTERRPAPRAAEEGKPRTRRRPPPVTEEMRQASARRRAEAALPMLEELPEGSGMMPPNPKSRTEALEMLRNSVVQEPNREVAVYVNTETGEHVLIQGTEDRVFVDRDAQGNPVGILGEGNPQRWKELLDSDRGNWQLVAHNHPGEADASRAGYARRLPSGRGGDFGVMMHEAGLAGERPGTPRSTSPTRAAPRSPNSPMTPVRRGPSRSSTTIPPPASVCSAASPAWSPTASSSGT